MEGSRYRLEEEESSDGRASPGRPMPWFVGLIGEGGRGMMVVVVVVVGVDVALEEGTKKAE